MQSVFMLYQVNVKIVEFQQFFWGGGGIGLFQNIPTINSREWSQEAWHQIWLTYDERYVLLYQINLKNYWIFTFFYVISEEGNGLFQQATVRTIIKKHDIKYGWLTPTAKSFYVGPNKHQNCSISTVFFWGGYWTFPEYSAKHP